MSTEQAPWPPLDEDARIIWPTDPQERAQLARKLFGRALVQTMDYFLDYAADFVINPRPAKPFEIENFCSALDRAYRQTFSSLSDRQREIVLRLVRDAVVGALQEGLASLDQLGVADVKIALVGKGPDGQVIEVPVTSIETDLAEQFVLCTEEFSRYASQLVDDLRSPPESA